MLGRQPGRLVEVRAVNIHSCLFYDLAFVLDASPDTVRTSRVGCEAVYPHPQAGDAVMLHLILGQVTEVEKQDEPV